MLLRGNHEPLKVNAIELWKNWIDNEFLLETCRQFPKKFTFCTFQNPFMYMYEDQLTDWLEFWMVHIRSFYFHTISISTQSVMYYLY